MEISYLNPIFYSYYFKIIEANLLDWNLDPVEGKGFYRKITGKYGHIELKIYQSSNDYQSNVIWNITEKQISSEYNYKPFVEKVLTFFIDYLSILKCERVNLTFEINNGSYNDVDSQDSHYEVATLLALINCFDKEHTQFDYVKFEKIAGINSLPSS